MSGVYIDSKGNVHDIATLEYFHLKAAYAKMARELGADDHPLRETLDEMKAELDRRDAEFAARKAANEGDDDGPAE